MRSFAPRYVLAKLLLQLRVVSAVARRELQLRAAKGAMGVAGVFVEPLALIVTFLALRIFLRGSGDSSYMNPALWLALGFIPFFMFAEIAIKAINGVEKSSEIYFYRRLRPLDSLMGNTLLLAQIYGSLLLLFVLGSAAWEWRPVVQDLGSLITLFLGLALLGFGIGLSTLVVGRRLPVVAWIMQLFLRRILLWTSCIFFSISIIPDAFRSWILWNPIAHGIELMRAACNPAYPIPGVSAIYFWGWVFGSVGFGLLVYGNNENLLFVVDKSLPDDSSRDGD
ncbi:MULTISPECIES: ABC transporter permease [unclassified Cyanobium]|uniref:ABC transporter permease n=1 Tax=unclassified Cyanobium TaxID=2627006 RepID=UPI0020CEFD87|nr:MULTISPECIES: ABC transporter permease [unclassified Cyanobium]MCP9778569.1 ABC transporter permease [Cyanobium sp. Tous-M-B4]MCP9876201.1 ABC transporter permease [Cyanobium sp. A2C-AMD]